MWSTWGGGREPGESLEQTVRRELAEEAGYRGPLTLYPLSENPQYVTFVGVVPQEFEPRPCSEWKDYCWVDQGQWPQPLHHKLMPALNRIRESLLSEGAVEDLEKDLRHPHSYDAIDHMMQTIAKKSGITAKKLHDLFVEKHGIIPDKWIKKDKKSNVSEDIDYQRHLALINAHMKKMGYRGLGGGGDAQVYAKAQGPVIKILIPADAKNVSSAEIPFLEFYKFCMNNRNNPHLPKFANIQGQDYADFYIDGERFVQIAQERLTEISAPSEYDDMLFEMIDSVERNVPLEGQYPGYELFYKTLQAVTRRGRDLGFENDFIKSDDDFNIMLRGQTLVITDPWVDYKESLTESLSRVAFHYTGIRAALKIVSSGEFELSSTLGSVEQQYAPRGKPYFLSTTRTRQGGYHRTIGQQAVLFVLDGNWFNQHYVSRSVDYWENRNPSLPHHRTHEAEDRVFSSEPTIPTGGVTAIHVYVDPNAEPEVRAQARQLMIAAKRQGIETHLYNDKTAWRNFDQRRTAAVSQLTGQEPARYRSRPEREYLLPWIELISAKSQSQLSKDADNLRYSLMYDYDRDNAAQGLGTDLSNARKPSAGADRANAVKLIQFMQRMGLATVKDLVQALSTKWRAEKKQSGVAENFADGQKPGRKGLARRVGVNCKQSVTKLRSIAKKSSGERQRMAHWCANMKSGKRK
jgi:hypothetical protein